MLQVIDSGKNSALRHMEKDRALLGELEHLEDPFLHLYEWESPCLTYGYFIQPSDYLNLEGIKKHHIQMARRPTGGGIIFHVYDLSFSVGVPAKHPAFSLNTLDNYAFINGIVRNVIEKFTGNHFASALLKETLKPSDNACEAFCMAKPTIYDIIRQGKKIGGAAQRRTRHGFLHQGSLFLAKPSDEFLGDVLKPGTQVLEGIKNHCGEILTENAPKILQRAKEEIKDLLSNSLQFL